MHNDLELDHISAETLGQFEYAAEKKLPRSDRIGGVLFHAERGNHPSALRW